MSYTNLSNYNTNYRGMVNAPTIVSGAVEVVPEFSTFGYNSLTHGIPTCSGYFNLQGAYGLAADDYSTRFVQRLCQGSPPVSQPVPMPVPMPVPEDIININIGGASGPMMNGGGMMDGGMMNGGGMMDGGMMNGGGMIDIMNGGVSGPMIEGFRQPYRNVNFKEGFASSGCRRCK